ncbi:glycosyltransferase family 2 protein [Paenibacillus roseipurpureus]|uniref:4,4'-diaponeurosporenoate glycosyltransferase n=1 Tax=Paenibacillus roseopurpureus TaxID=2918901 RepID=A0AA96LW41_9BACL|nr:glycosyltransferase family 2 protein [Paenibacillus sp. MBLB1832]WNR45745.1 glycosyltransferase family 2 protein [Paenibacillus sp. MBLB1832]
MSDNKVELDAEQVSPSSSAPSPPPVVSVIIPVCNEAATLAKVIRQAFLVHKHTEVIVIENGSTDGSKEIAERAGARVFSFPHRLGHDVGRSLGAKEAKGDILLFVDADFIIPAKEMIPLIQAVEQGVDVALNKYNGNTSNKEIHRVVLAKYALNAILSRADLQGNSMTSIPHAISRRALQTIGAENLAIPPLAQTIAIQSGLRIRAPHYIEVGNRNRVRTHATPGDPVGDLILGDHLEAIGWLIQATDARAHLLDKTRKREKLR